MDKRTAEKRKADGVTAPNGRTPKAFEISRVTTFERSDLFILFGLVARNRFWNAVITVWSLLYLGLFASLFVRGWWAF